jgi:hypothetical protein
MALLFVDLCKDCPFPHPPNNHIVPCARGEQAYGHYRFWVIQRRPAGQMGHFMVFRINGEEHVIDASVPTHLDRLPRDAVEITGDLYENILHATTGSHVWGDPYLQEVAKIAKPIPGGYRRRFGQFDRRSA